MKKENVRTFKKTISVCLSACIAGQSLGFMPVKASSSDGDDIETRVKPQISCTALVPTDKLLSDLRSEESMRLIGRIFPSSTAAEREEIIKKAYSSPGHMDLLRIGFDVCLAYDRAPKGCKRIRLKEWECGAVCKLIELSWDSSFISKQKQRYQDNEHIKCYMKHVLADEKLDVSVAERYLDITLFSLAYLGKVEPCISSSSSSLSSVLLRNAEIWAVNCVDESLVLICAFDKGGYRHLADCIWGLISQRPIFKKYGHPFSGNCGSYDMNNSCTWMEQVVFKHCREVLEDKSFDSSPEKVSKGFLDELEKRETSRRAEKAEREAKAREREESRLRKIEERREQELKRQERKAQRQEEQRLLREKEAEAKRQKEEEIRLKDQETARLKEEEEDRRRAEEKAKRDAEEAAEREKEARLKAEHDASGVTAVIDANARIWKFHANEPNHDDKGLKFQK